MAALIAWNPLRIPQPTLPKPYRSRLGPQLVCFRRPSLSPCPGRGANPSPRSGQCSISGIYGHFTVQQLGLTAAHAIPWRLHQGPKHRDPRPRPPRLAAGTRGRDPGSGSQARRGGYLLCAYSSARSSLLNGPCDPFSSTRPAIRHPVYARHGAGVAPQEVSLVACLASCLHPHLKRFTMVLRWLNVAGPTVPPKPDLA